MRKTVSLFVLFGLLFVLMPASSLGTQSSPQAAEPGKPKLIALLMYADWCASCRVLEPKLNEVKREFQGKPVLFTRFDLTDEFTKDQSAQYAAWVGLGEYYVENEGKTGFLLLIDAESKKLLGKVTKEKSPDEIRSMLKHALMGHPAG